MLIIVEKFKLFFIDVRPLEIAAQRKNPAPGKGRKIEA
jgi:hypothetical protein